MNEEAPGTSGEITEVDLSQLLDRAHVVHVCAGRLLMQEGKKTGWAGVVLSGQVAVQRQTEGGIVTIALLGAGSVIGEMGLLDEKEASASIQVAQDAVLLRMEEASFEQLLLDEPITGMRLVRALTGVMSRRLRAANTQMD